MNPRPVPATLPLQHQSELIDRTMAESSVRPEVTLGYLAAMLRRHRLLIGACLLGTLALAILYTVLSVPVYQATTLLRVESNEVNLPQLVQLLSTENRIGTEIAVLQDHSAAQGVVDSLGLRAQLAAPRGARRSTLFTLLHVAPAADTLTLSLAAAPDGKVAIWGPDSASEHWSSRLGDTTHVRGITFALAPAAAGLSDIQLKVVSPDQAVADYQARLDVSRPSKDADLIAIQVEGRDPVEIAAAANLMGDQLIAGRRNLQIGQSQSNVQFLRQQLDTLAGELRTAEDTLRAYREREGIVDTAEAARSQVGRLVQVQADRGAIVAERDALARLLQQVRSDSTKGGAAAGNLSRTLMAFPTLLRNQATSELFAALATVEDQRAALLVRRKPNDPDVQILTNRIRQLDGQLEGIAETYLQGLTDQVHALNNVANGFGKALDSLPRKEIGVARRERAVSVQQSLYTLVQTRLKEAQVTQAMADPTVRVVDPAVVPARPVRPKPLINLVLALILGSFVGVSASFARDLTDRSVRSRADALLGSGLPVLGAIPRVESHRTKFLPRRRRETVAPAVVLDRRRNAELNLNPNGGRAAAHVRSLLLTRTEASPSYAEALNRLYANMVLAHRDRALKTVAVTSPLPGEGKTLTSINLAVTLAERRVKVLLIDGDLRRGMISLVFGCSRTPGLAELLTGAAQPEQCLWQTPISDSATLTVVPSGGLLRTPGPLLKLERVRQLLDTLAEPFDLVIVDTPPVNLLADAALLGAACDAVLLVLRAGHTTVDTLHFATDQLTAARAPVIGTVLNDIDLRRHGGDDQSYRYLGEVERYYAGGPDAAVAR